MQLSEWWVTLCLCLRQYAQVLGNGCTRYRLTQHSVNNKVQAEECNAKELELGALLKRGEAHDAFAIVRS